MLSGKFRDGELISGAALGALGAYVILAASRWTYLGPEGPGPGFFPMWYGIGILGLSLLLCVRKLLAETVRSSSTVDWKGVASALMTWAGFALSVPLIKVLGFTIGFSLFSFFLHTIIFGRPLLRSAIISVASAIGFAVLFGVLLQIPLPTGIFGNF